MLCRYVQSIACRPEGRFEGARRHSVRGAGRHSVRGARRHSVPIGRTQSPVNRLERWSPPSTTLDKPGTAPARRSGTSIGWWPLRSKPASADHFPWVTGWSSWRPPAERAVNPARSRWWPAGWVTPSGYRQCGPTPSGLRTFWLSHRSVFGSGVGNDRRRRRLCPEHLSRWSLSSWTDQRLLTCHADT